MLGDTFEIFKAACVGQAIEVDQFGDLRPANDMVDEIGADKASAARDKKVHGRGGKSNNKVTKKPTLLSASLVSFVSLLLCCLSFQHLFEALFPMRQTQAEGALKFGAAKHRVGGPPRRRRIRRGRNRFNSRAFFPLGGHEIDDGL